MPGDKEHDVLNNISLKYENVLLEYCNKKKSKITSHLHKPQTLHNLLFPVGSSHGAFDSCHYMQFMWVFWITTILVMFFCPFLKYLKDENMVLCHYVQ